MTLFCFYPILGFFQLEEGMSFWGNMTNLIHLHLLFALSFLISYSIKSLLFLSGKNEAFLAFKKKTILAETLFSVGFLVFGFWVFLFHIQSGAYASMHWLDPKITLALIGIPVGIIGFKKENRIMVAVSWAFFLVAAVIGFMHYH